MAGRPGVRGGASTRGFPPGSAQALVALVLGSIAAVNGFQQGEPGWAAVLLVVALLGALQLARLVRRRGRPASRTPPAAPAPPPAPEPPPAPGPPAAPAPPASRAPREDVPPGT